MNSKHLEITSSVNEILNTTNNYIKNAIPLIQNLADGFYQQPNRDTWDQLVDLFEGITWIIEVLVEIDGVKELNDILEYVIWNEYVQKVARLNEVVSEMEGALQIDDNILIADLLLYEIVPVFEDMQNKLSLLNPVVVDQDVN